MFAGQATAQDANANSAIPQSLIKLDRPFLFAYGTWEKRARIENGVALLDASGITPRGGAGLNQDLDLSGHEDDCLALRVKVGSRNTLKTLKLLIRDGADHTGTWIFNLPKPSDTSVVITPVDAAPFAHANEPGKSGAVAWDKVKQWQMMGDWGGDGPVDLRVEAILVVKADDSANYKALALRHSAFHASGLAGGG